MGIKLELLGRVLAEDVAIQQPQALYESYSAPSYLPVYSNVLEPISFTPEITTPVFTKPIADPELIKQVFTPLPPPQHVEPDILTQQTPIIMEGIEDIFSLINNVSKTVSTVAPLFSGSASSSGGGRSAPAIQSSEAAQQQRQQLLLQQQQAEQARLAKEKSDNIMLYVGLGVGGGLLLLGGGYLVLRNKKKSAGMGRVKKIKSTRKPVSRKSASKKKRKVKR